MSRSGYNDCDDGDYWQFICWRGAVTSAMNGRRGQAFLREMLDAMDALPEPKLTAHELVSHVGPRGPLKIPKACAIGTVALKRGVDVSNLDPENYDAVANAFGISSALAREIVYINDEWEQDPVKRFYAVRRWVKASIIGPVIIEDESGRWADDGGRV